MLRVGFLALGCMVFAACTSRVEQQREPSNLMQEADNVRIGALELKPGNPNNQYLILGIDRTNAPPFTFKANLKDFGFKGENIEAVEPKFLISMNRLGPVDVHSFDLSVPDLSHIAHDRSGRIINTTSSAGAGEWNTVRINRLPSKLLEVGKAHDAILLRAAFAIVLKVLQLAPTPLSVASRAIVVGEGHNRSKKDVEAQWLQYLVSQALDHDNVAVLKKYLSESQLRTLGAELSVRYNREWDFAGLGASKVEAHEQYDVFRNVRRGHMATNFARLSRIANMQGFLVVPMTPHFALVYADAQWLDSKTFSKANYNSQYLSADASEKLGQKYKEIINDQSLIPIGVFALSESGAPLEMIDFSEPLKHAKNERIKKTAQAAKEIGYGFIPIPYLTMGLTVAEGVIKFVVRKHGSTVLNYRVRASGELQAAIESGLVDIDTNSILVAAIEDNLSSYGFPPEQIDYYKKALQSPDKETVQKTTQDVLAAIAQREERMGRLIPEGERDQGRRQLGKYVWMERLKFRLNSSRTVERTIASLESSALATEKKWLVEEQLRQKKLTPSEAVMKVAKTPAYPWDKDAVTPVILFLVDGLRPDRLKEAVKQQHLPYLEQLFVKRGVEFESYSPRSITLPSWASALTGFDIDEHGLKSNTPANRFSDGKFSESYLDYRKDVFFPAYWSQNRSYKHLSESGVNWLPRYYFKHETLLSYMPINDGEYPPLGYLAKQAVTEIPKFLYKIHDAAETLDRSQAARMARLINDQASVLKDEINKGKRKSPSFRFVALWLASVDHFSHKNSHRLNESMKIVDDSIGLIVEATKGHPVLKDAFVYLISDHGHIGGPEKAQHSHFLDNTQFNLTHFFAGDFIEHQKYRFNVGSPESPEPDFDLKFLSEFLIQPFRYTYPRANQERDVLLDYSGDSLAQVYLRPESGWASERRYTFAELRDFKLSSGGSMTRYDLVGDLLNVRLRNLESASDKVLADKVRTQSSGGRPVQYFAMALQGPEAKSSAQSLVGLESQESLSREPVLVVDRNQNMGLIVSREVLGETLFQYLVIEQFVQDPQSGAFSAKLSFDSAKDPLGLKGPLDWKAEREWIASQQQSPRPTVIPSLIRVLTNTKKVDAEYKRRAENPDFILSANWGFNFNSGHETQSDHGGLLKEEVRNTFIMSRLGERAFPGYFMVKGPVLLKDVAPTVLDTAGLQVSALTSGKSLKPVAEAVLASPFRRPASDGDFSMSADRGLYYLESAENN
jgi:hypothetical protein